MNQGNSTNPFLALAADDCIRPLLEALAGEPTSRLTRLVNMQYFTYSYFGDDAVLTEEERERVEAAAGAKLIEHVYPDFMLEIALVLPTPALALARQALEEVPA